MMPKRLPSRPNTSDPSPVRTFDERGLHLIHQIEPRWRYSPSRMWLVVGVASVGLSLRMGLLPAAFVTVAVLALPQFVVRLVAARSRRAIEDHLPEFCIDVARGLRSGQSMRAAIGHTIDAAPELTPPQACKVIREHDAGRPMSAAIGEWAGRRSISGSERLLAQALHVGSLAGGPVGPSLDLISDSIRAELVANRRRESLTSQARYSARVLTALPVGVAALTGVLSESAVYSRPIAMVSLVVGVLLAGLGLLWMNWLIGRVA